jgi:hypothetical protein
MPISVVGNARLTPEGNDKDLKPVSNFELGDTIVVTVPKVKNV